VPAMTNSRTYSVARALAALAAGLSTLVLSSTAAAPSAQGAAESRRATPVPILMYHVIGDPRAGAPYPQLYVSEREFRAQVRWLARHGYRAVTLRAVWEHWHRGKPLPRRPVVISFDDGYRSWAHAAFPALRDLNWPGVLNLAVKNLQVSGGISPKQVRRLIKAGWELDAHTVTHPDLTTLGDRELSREVAGSRRKLQRLFHVPVDFFCYPSGRYDGRVIAAVRRAGFLGATTTVEGLATPGRPYELSRVRVSRGDGTAGLAEKLVSGS
jgi:peptidoglycan/xylan/chitin deacetylase (PgdA/CDA1 family)